MWKSPFLAGVLALWACTNSDRAPPGNEIMGAFDFTTALPVLSDGGIDPSFTDCQFSELAFSNFQFQGTFSRNRGTSQAWFTSNNVSRPAVFDGQKVTSTTSAPREFSECDGGVNMVETLSVALLSESQNTLLGQCPANPLDGGVPVLPDAGVLAPDTTPHGFDAVRACGVLADQVFPDSTCVGGFPGPAAPCTMMYPVSGVRR